MWKVASYSVLPCVQAQDAGSKVANKAKNVASDLSELPNLTKQPNFFKGEGEVNATNEIKNKVHLSSFCMAWICFLGVKPTLRCATNLPRGSWVDVLSRGNL